ncbi:MAG TPA: hypothetical protein IAB17_03130 [Candidatus Alectryocaccobium stercorigallinarum]|nr:hypothetical protein [Candidatus Alectryocaccobium stercorigallinarum]
MKTARQIRKSIAGVLAAVLAFMLLAGIIAVPVKAESGTVYTCTIHPCYAHPVTGVIEDSGGEASYATGQGMVEGAVYTTGMLEVTDSGGYYLTIRLSLMDYTSNHSFWVQPVGGSGWTTPALGVTGNGTDNNGSTADVCIQVPSENCVVRCAMYVEPMGRDVIFYLYPSDFSEGNNTDMNAAMVTAPAGSGAQTQTGGTETDSASAQPSQTAPPAESGSSLTAEPTAAPTPEAAASGSTEETAEESQDESAEETPALATGENELQNSITEAAQPVLDGSGDEALNSAQGLSLSTQNEADQEQSASADGVSAARIAELIIAITVSGLILLAAASGILYHFRKNWKKWGGGYEDDDDYEE